MRGQAIDLFLWGYQEHFRILFKVLMDNVMKELGIPESGVECLLVGAKIPGCQNLNDVCVEPKDGKWPVELFDGLLDKIEKEIPTHSLENIFYGDGPSMRDKPENIRRDSVRIAVQKALKTYDSEHDVRSFAGRPTPANDHYVVPVLQLPNELFERFRSLRESVSNGHFTFQASLIAAAVSTVLTEAYDELLRPELGRNLFGQSCSPYEIIRRAAASFMHTPGVAIGEKNTVRFYGWAMIKGDEARQNGRELGYDKIPENPLHTNIIPPDDTKETQEDHAQQLAAIAYLRKYPSTS